MGIDAQHGKATNAMRCFFMTWRLPFLLSLLGIVSMVAAMLIGPSYSPKVFNWIVHSTSEQAGQQLAGAWIMRVGFVGYGLGTLLAALTDWSTRTLVRIALALFGIGLIGTAIWSNASILPGFPSDMDEDRMHSLASGVVGTAFAAACAARLFSPDGSRRDWLSWAGLGISVVVPVAMDQAPDIRGLLQRIMFAFSFVFVAREFGAAARGPGTERQD
jgi:hypothetical protein